MNGFGTPATALSTCVGGSDMVTIGMTTGCWAVRIWVKLVFMVEFEVFCYAG